MGLNGLTLTRQIRANSDIAAISLITLTALAMLGDKERCLDTGALKYITKPFNFKQLSRLINNLLINNQQIKKRCELK
ncbi:MAG TPA: response regulator [Oculatellaceae cyanobacterium]|jgi:DNA-binding response OmpR family regulator